MQLVVQLVVASVTAVVASNPRLEIMEGILSCERCSLWEGCTAPVPFSGPEHPTVAILGEAPGEQEDLAGQPFVGPAGQLIRHLLRDVAQLEPEECAFYNTVSCWPRGTPEPEHIFACAENRERQFAHLSPTWLLVLGSVALQSLRTELTITRGRGHPFLHGEAVTFAAYHPSAALRNRMMENPLRDDLRKFGAMVRSGRENWHSFISDRCGMCLDFVYRYDETGMGFCRLHHPENRKPKRVEKTTMLTQPETVESQKMFEVEPVRKKRQSVA